MKKAPTGLCGAMRWPVKWRVEAVMVFSDRKHKAYRPGDAEWLAGGGLMVVCGGMVGFAPSAPCPYRPVEIRWNAETGKYYTP